MGVLLYNAALNIDSFSRFFDMLRTCLLSFHRYRRVWLKINKPLLSFDFGFPVTIFKRIPTLFLFNRQGVSKKWHQKTRLKDYLLT